MQLPLATHTLHLLATADAARHGRLVNQESNLPEFALLGPMPPNNTRFAPTSPDLVGDWSLIGGRQTNFTSLIKYQAKSFHF